MAHGARETITVQIEATVNRRCAGFVPKAVESGLILCHKLAFSRWQALQVIET
jgi:hypothetical protein